jgi:hypothetical protein
VEEKANEAFEAKEEKDEATIQVMRSRPYLTSF